MLYFQNERRHGTRKLKKVLFLHVTVGHLQPPKDKNSRHLAILILQFDEIIVKIILVLILMHRTSKKAIKRWGQCASFLKKKKTEKQLRNIR